MKYISVVERVFVYFYRKLCLEEYLVTTFFLVTLFSVPIRLPEFRA